MTDPIDDSVILIGDLRSVSRWVHVINLDYFYIVLREALHSEIVGGQNMTGRYFLCMLYDDEAFAPSYCVWHEGLIRYDALISRGVL